MNYREGFSTLPTGNCPVDEGQIEFPCSNWVWLGAGLFKVVNW